MAKEQWCDLDDLLSFITRKSHMTKAVERCGQAVKRRLT